MTKTNGNVTQVNLYPADCKAQQDSMKKTNVKHKQQRSTAPERSEKFTSILSDPIIFFKDNSNFN